MVVFVGYWTIMQLYPTLEGIADGEVFCVR